MYLWQTICILTDFSFLCRWYWASNVDSNYFEILLRKNWQWKWMESTYQRFAICKKKQHFYFKFFSLFSFTWQRLENMNSDGFTFKMNLCNEYFGICNALPNPHNYLVIISTYICSFSILNWFSFFSQRIFRRF